MLCGVYPYDKKHDENKWQIKQRNHKNSATNQKRAYRVGTDLVRTGYTRIWPGILWGRTHDVRS